MKVAVFYPWTDIFERNSGSSRRVSLMIEFFKRSGYEVRVVVPCLASDVDDGNVKYTSYRQTSLNYYCSRLASKACGLALGALTFGGSRPWDKVLWQHLDPAALNPEFARCVERAVDWADAAIVEYTFFAAPVIKACRRKGIRSVITAHDVLFHQVTGSSIARHIARAMEVNALKKADHVVCVSENDRRIFSECGIKAQTIPHGIDADRYGNALTEGVMASRLRKLEGVKLPPKNICLFVGNMYHHPNVEAVEHIRAIAKEMSSKGQEANFVLAGRGSKIEISGNYYALGEVDGDMLEALYNLADIVLIPLSSGTGASVKTIEAMGWSKPVLGTNVGFRGYPVKSGVDCIVSDDIHDYPRLISDLLNEPEKRKTLGQNARKFAEGYDYRRVYKKYAEMIA